MGDSIQRTEAIIKAHKATEHRDLRRTALTLVDDYLCVYRKRFTDTELRALREECFRIEAARLGMSRTDVNNHWHAIVDIEKLSKRIAEGEETATGFPGDISVPLTTRRRSTPRNGRVKRAIKRFQGLSHRDLKMLIREADLKWARELLSKRKPDADLFFLAISKLSNYSVALARWKSLVESCYQRLSEQDRKNVRSDILGFYWMLRDYRALEAFLPAKPRRWVEAPQEMETYLRLKRLSKAKVLAALCESKLHPEKRFRYELPLRLALSQYYAHIGNYNSALEQHRKMDTGNLWDYGEYQRLISIKANEALLIAEKAQQEISQSAKKARSNGDPVVLNEKRQLKWTISRLRAIRRRLD